MFFNKYNFQIKDFCDKGNSRPEITGIFCEPNRTTATDSFTLISVSTPKGFNLADYPVMPNKSKPIENFKPFILPNQEAEKLVKPLSRDKLSLPILENAVVLKRDKEMIEIGTTDLQSFDGVYSRVIEGEYPKFNDLLVERGNFVEIKVNPAFLLKLAKFFSGFNKKELTIKVPVKPNEPIRFYGKRDNQEAKGLLMPIKAE